MGLASLAHKLVDSVVLLLWLDTFLVAHFFETLCIGRSDERRLHVINASLWVHKVLVIFAFDLNHPHHDSVDHVDRLALIVLAFSILVFAFDTLTILVHIVLNALPAVVVDALLTSLQVLVTSIDIVLVVVALGRLVLDIVCSIVRIVCSVRVVAVLGLHLVLLLLLVLLRVSRIIEVVVVEIGLFGLLAQQLVVLRKLLDLLLVSLEEDGVRDGALACALQRWQVLLLLLVEVAHFGNGLNRWHVRLRTVARDFVLNLEIVETLTLVQSVHVLHASAHLITFDLIGSWCTNLLIRAAIARVVRLLGRITVRIVDKALLLKEVFASSFPCLVSLVSTARKGVILNVDLPLDLWSVPSIVGIVAVLDVLLEHCDETHELAPFDLLRVEVVGFSYVQVRHNLVRCLCHQHVLVNIDVVVELLVALLLEVVHDGHLRRVVLYHELGRH